MRILFGLIILLASSIASGQTLSKDVENASKYLATIDTVNRPYIKFLTFYAVPEKLRQDFILANSFWIHSMVGPTEDGSGNTGYYAPLAQRVLVKRDPKIHTEANTYYYSTVDNDTVEIFKPIQNVKFKDENGQEIVSDTLYWLDIRDYNWKQQTWEDISFAEPYILKEFINAYDYDNLRILGGNAIIRGDWFLAWTCDTTKRADRGLEPFYYQLLYSHVKIPKTSEELRQIWGVEKKRLDKLGTVLGSVVDFGKSEVSRNTRELAGARTELGYWYETSDYKFNDDIDPLEDFSVERGADGIPRHKAIARDADAHETIFTNALGLQGYYLTDKQEKRVEFADPTIVFDKRDLTNDIRVRTARSCVVCHTQGLNPPLNAIREYLDNGVDLIVGSKDYQQAVTKFYLTLFGARLADDNAIYARASVSTNGLLPEENARIMQKCMDWYDKSVDLKQAALECGVSVDKLTEKLSPAVGARLARLGVYNSRQELKDGEKPKTGAPIPRHLWDNPKGGHYVQAMALVHKLEALPVTSTVFEQPVGPPAGTITALYDALIKRKDEEIGRMKRGESIEFVEKVGEWYKVKATDGTFGYIYSPHVKENK